MKLVMSMVSLSALTTPVVAATLFLVDPSTVTTAPIVTSPEAFTESGPVTWNGVGLFDGVFSAADIDAFNAQLGIVGDSAFKIWTVTFNVAGPWKVSGAFAPGTIPVWAMGPIVPSSILGDPSPNDGDAGGGGGGSGPPCAVCGGPGPGPVANTVPELATWLMFGVGFVLLASVGWRKSRKRLA